MEKEIAMPWIDLTFEINSVIFTKYKIVLNKVRGSVDFGSLNALMGPSGAGKTSLLKCINGRNKSGLRNGTKIYLSADKKIRSCFVGQQEKEHLIMGLTVKQNMIYASKLKNSNEIIEIDHQNNVMKLMSELMINDIGDTNVEKCSGGEKKRLSIALELTSKAKPNLLCIDEPTSGLDSYAAEVVIECLKEISEKHKISIITSIHQPNNHIVLVLYCPISRKTRKKSLEKNAIEV